MSHAPPRGSKLPAKYENPLDRLLIAMLTPLMLLIHALGLTPNMLTAGSALCAAAGLYFMVRGRVWPALTLWALNYLFDLADGLKARLYDQQSSLGDWWDHQSDVLSVVGLWAVIAWKIGGWAGFRGWGNIWPVVVEAVLLVVGLKHMSCQERYSRERTSQYIPIAGINPESCGDVGVMRWTRWGGIATMTLWHMFLIYKYGYL